MICMYMYFSHWELGHELSGRIRRVYTRSALGVLIYIYIHTLYTYPYLWCICICISVNGSWPTNWVGEYVEYTHEVLWVFPYVYIYIHYIYIHIYGIYVYVFQSLGAGPRTEWENSLSIHTERFGCTYCLRSDSTEDQEVIENIISYVHINPYIYIFIYNIVYTYIYLHNIRCIFPLFLHYFPIIFVFVLQLKIKRCGATSDTHIFQILYR